MKSMIVALHKAWAGDPRIPPGAQIGEDERKPRMRIGEGLTGSSAAIREPVMIAKGANLDPRFKAFKNLPEG